jgi:hypothetical protein
MLKYHMDNNGEVKCIIGNFNSLNSAINICITNKLQPLARQLVPSLKIRAQPINPLRLVPTSLSFDLLKDKSTDNQLLFGYVTIDQARHVLPLSTDDRMVSQLPLIGLCVLS